MKIRLLLVTYLLYVFSLNSFSQAGVWTWVKGDTISTPTPVFGTKGVEAATNNPPGVYEPCEWTDTSGNFWFLGGVDGAFVPWGDLWRYNPTTNNWTWMKGTGQSYAGTVFGTKGVPAAKNEPGDRGFGTPSWVDNNGDFWLYGGQYSNDVWRYHVATNEWTWMQGSQGGGPAVYGALGVEDAANTPGSRYECSATWADDSNHLWLYGGFYFHTNGGFYGDMWRYDISTNLWAWMGGSNQFNAAAVYGTKGVAAANNTPGGRKGYGAWTDASGNFWMFGGQGLQDTYNDMWRYNPGTGQWTWMSGTSETPNSGTYGNPCAGDISFAPVSRFENRARWKDDCGNFWLYGGGNSAVSMFYSDLWYFNPVSLQWTLANGGASANVQPVFGTMGTGSAATTPGGLMGAVAWRGKAGALYLFGGYINNDTAYNTLYKFTIDSTCGIIGATASVNLGGDTTYCSGFSRILSAGNASAIWSTGDTASQITVTQPGLYSVAVPGCSGYVTDSITISQQTPVNSFTLGADTTYCASFVRVLTSGNTGTLWSTGDTGVQITITSPGVYWATSSNSCNVVSDTIKISQSIVALQCDSVNTTCGQSNGLVSVATTSGTAPFNFHWNTGGSSDTLTALAAGTYSATVTDQAGCSASISTSVNSTGTGVKLQVDSVNTTCGLNNGIVSVETTSGTAPFSFNWNNGSITDSLTALAAGAYVVTVTDHEGCSATAGAIVDSSSAAVVNITTNTNTICTGDSASICAPSGYTSYQWNTGERSTCIEIKQEGNYYVTVTEPGGCSAASNHISIIVYPSPPVSTSLSRDTLRAYNALSYQWYLNGVLLPGQTDSILIAHESGSYSVAITDSNGCSSLSNDIIVNLTGISNIQNQLSLKLFPDPATDELNISYILNQVTNIQITLTDPTGRFIQTILNEMEGSGNYVQKLNISRLADGVYMINFVAKSGTAVLRFVKQ